MAAKNIPTDAGSVIVHGDYRLGNVLIRNRTKNCRGAGLGAFNLGDGLADYLCQDYHGDAYDDEGLAGADYDAWAYLLKRSLLQNTASTPMVSTTGPFI